MVLFSTGMQTMTFKVRFLSLDKTPFGKLNFDCLMYDSHLPSITIIKNQAEIPKCVLACWYQHEILWFNHLFKGQKMNSCFSSWKTKRWRVSRACLAIHKWNNAMPLCGVLCMKSHRNNFPVSRSFSHFYLFIFFDHRLLPICNSFVKANVMTASCAKVIETFNLADLCCDLTWSWISRKLLAKPQRSDYPFCRLNCLYMLVFCLVAVLNRISSHRSMES